MHESTMISVRGEAENLNNYYSPVNLVGSPSPTIDLVMVTLNSSQNQSHGQIDNLTIKLVYLQSIVCERHHTV